jgi:hypothetical protein
VDREHLDHLERVAHLAEELCRSAGPQPVGGTDTNTQRVNGNRLMALADEVGVLLPEPRWVP